MTSKYSDTIAREQQIREYSHGTKTVSSSTRARTNQSETKFYEIIIVVIVHFTLAIFLLGRFTMSNGPLLEQAFYALIYTSNETFTETPPFLQTIR